MYKLSDLIGKEAITLSDAKKQGVIFNAHFDEALRQCKYFTLINHDEEIRWVDFKNVLSLEKDAVVIRSSEDLTELCPAATVPSPINLKAFNQDGVMLGFVRDVDMEDGKAVKFITESGEIASLTLLSISDEILVFNDTGKPMKVKPQKRQAKSSASPARAQAHARAADKPQGAAANISAVKGAQTNTQPIFTMSPAPAQKTSLEQTAYRDKYAAAPAANPGEHDKTQRSSAPQDIQKIPQEKTDVRRSPQQQTASKYSFLLGKRLQRNIYDSKGAIIAHENDLITEPIIRIAKESGKLVTLALHSL